MKQNNTQPTPLNDKQNWKFTGYDKKDKEIASFTIEGRTEHEANKEALHYTEARQEIEDWTLTLLNDKQGEEGRQQKELRLIRWANDGFPPIDLNNETNAVLHLIKDYKKIKAENDKLREALKECSPLIDALINRTESGKARNELTDINIKVKTVLNNQ
jgi:hypothetical protein